MEEARYWMWTKDKHSLSSSHGQTLLTNDSWEEQAFAEDAAGPLGGCIWPPRSYTCSFCRREFRSAQALGGHMNVHRRDRARLKQSTTPHNEILLHHHHQYKNSSLGAEVSYPSQVGGSNLVCNTNPNSDFGYALGSPLTTSRVSAPSIGSRERLSFLPPIVHGDHKKPSFSSPPSLTNLVAGKYFCVPDLKADGEKKARIFEPDGCRAKKDYSCTKPDLSVSLNLVLCGKEEAASSLKRRRADHHASPLPFFKKPSTSDRHHVGPEVLELSPSSLEDLDLELRL